MPRAIVELPYILLLSYLFRPSEAMIGNDWSPNVDRIDRYIAMRASIAAKQIIVFGPVSPCVRLCLRNK